MFTIGNIVGIIFGCLIALCARWHLSELFNLIPSEFYRDFSLVSTVAIVKLAFSGLLEGFLTPEIYNRKIFGSSNKNLSVTIADINSLVIKFLPFTGSLQRYLNIVYTSLE